MAAKKAKNKRSEPTPEQAALQIYGQYLYATGSGAGRQWVSLKAIQVLYDRYYQTILEVVTGAYPDKWEAEWTEAAPYILDYMRTIGQVAANTALEDGRHSIEDLDMERAILLVEVNYNKPSTGKSPLRGKWCPRR